MQAARFAEGSEPDDFVPGEDGPDGAVAGAGRRA